MKKLTSDNVHEILIDCLFKQGEEHLHPTAILARGVVTSLGFHPDRLESHREEIRELLSQLPDTFKKESGGGMSFLNACNTQDGTQWGEHRNIDELIMLGLATGMVQFCLPREVWGALPGGMPYFWVETGPIPAAA